MAIANENGTLVSHLIPTQTAPKITPIVAPAHTQKDFRDILSYEDKWIGWDGPVWCKRYGRFENKEQAAEDDGYKHDSPVGHRGTHYLPFQNSPRHYCRLTDDAYLDPETQQIHQCQNEGCACRVPFEHRSYVKDIQRRIEPMTASLVALEHQFGKLVHHIVQDGEHKLHEAFSHEDEQERFATHTASGHQADGPMHAEHFEKQHHQSMAETVAKLEAKVHSLTHQLHVLVKQNDELIRNGHVGPGEHHYWQVPQ